MNERLEQLRAECAQAFDDLLDACKQLHEAHARLNRMQQRYADLTSEITTELAKEGPTP